MARLFELREAGMRYGKVDVLRSVTLNFHAGEFVAIAGPNGAGKSTLLWLLAGLSTPTFGACLFDGNPAHQWNRREFARRVAVVTQAGPSAFPFTAEEVVYMGRMPHRKGMYETVEDNAAVDKALAATESEAFRARHFGTLSGGERQRILLASALAQEPQVLLLDEPSTHLDLHHQISLHKLLLDLSRSGLLVITVTHDLNLAAGYAHRVVLLDRGSVHGDGPPVDVLTPRTIEDVFQVRAELHHRASGQPWLVYGE
jgi:iron complex transport system ATP-binding protein